MKAIYDKIYPEPNTGCWIWGGASKTSGHGTISKSTYGFSLAHRYVYFLEKGDFDRSKYICHTCDNQICVNPDHLYVGDASTNVQDLIKRGNPKWATGNRIHTAKLNPEKVKEIRKLQGTISNRSIAKKFKVTHNTINKIFNGTRWKEVA